MSNAEDEGVGDASKRKKRLMEEKVVWEDLRNKLRSFVFSVSCIYVCLTNGSITYMHILMFNL